MTLHAGDRLGAYEILAPLGSGGMGEVWRARDTRLKREVAIKVLPDSLASDPVARTRFDREARAVAALSHPNILDIHDVGSEGGIAWAVTELLEGQTLKARLDEGALPWRRAVEVALALAEGLEAAHARGVVHRDIKPSNVFLTSDGRVKILDFGIATLDDSTSLSLGARDVTEPHAIVGTAGYLSPEQIRREAADARSDIFSLGCVLYEMVTGRRTFPGDTPPEALVATLRGEPRDPADLVTGLPPELRRLILRCLEKRPDRRFQTAADLAFALKIPFTGSGGGHEFVSATDETEVIASAANASPKRRAASVAAGGALFASVLAAAAWMLFFRGAGPAGNVLAVLPFTNETGDSAHEYLSEGVTDSLIDALSKTPGLSVLARSTVYLVPDRHDPRKAGRFLHARTVLVGRVKRQGADLHVDAELVDVATGARLWHKIVTDRAGDPVPAAADLAPGIARTLRPALTAEEEKNVAGRRHENPEAWDRVQRGRFFLKRRTEEGIFKALGYFQDAALLEPREADAWCGMAEVYHLLAYYSYAEPAELVPKEREVAAKAAALDPTLSGPHAILADIRYLTDHDWPGAEEEFRKAIALNPSDAEAHQWYSNFLSAAGRPDEALAEILRARTLDPLSAVIQADVGLARYFGGDMAGGEKEIRRAIELDPHAFLPRLWASLPLLAQKRYDEALVELGKAREIERAVPEPIAFWGYASALAGRPADADAARRDLDALKKERYVGGFPYAILTLGQKKREESLDWLEKSAAAGDGRLAYLGVEPGFDPLRSDPRFTAVVRHLAIPKPR
ncbi:MAG TPA: protein kinase [Thermoanaerobaculia bacterium]|nr:protein kinase [Thermoanaerobaculia bacterium]